MKPKALFFDIDGTLLSAAQPVLSRELKEALYTISSQGIRLFIASGRSPAEIQELKLAEDFAFDGWILLNGNYCLVDGQVIFSCPIPAADIENCLEYLQFQNLPCLFVLEKEVCLNRVDETVRLVQASIHSSIPETGDLFQKRNQPVYQVIPYASAEQAREMVSLMPHCKMTSWHPLAFDIVNQCGGKQAGMKKVLEYFQIDPRDTMAFGDGENDLEMFAMAGKAVAMGNADSKVKKAADYITSPVDQQGLLKAFHHFHLI